MSALSRVLLVLSRETRASCGRKRKGIGPRRLVVGLRISSYYLSVSDNPFSIRCENTVILSYALMLEFEKISSGYKRRVLSKMSER